MSMTTEQARQTPQRTRTRRSRPAQSRSAQSRSAQSRSAQSRSAQARPAQSRTPRARRPAPAKPQPAQPAKPAEPTSAARQQPGEQPAKQETKKVKQETAQDAKQAKPQQKGKVVPTLTPAEHERRLHRYQLETSLGSFTTAERAARGKAARRDVPREAHALLDLPSDRTDPVDLLEEQARTRVTELVPVRYGRMMVSPFSYFRGAALPMAADLAQTPVTGLPVQACGDAHLSNFGMFGSAERRLVFDVNDFDETLPGPWEWDIKRLAASLEVAARVNGFSRKQRRSIVTASAASYRRAMRGFARMGDLDVWYAHTDMDQFRSRFGDRMSGRQRKLMGKGLAKARTRDSMQEVAKLTRMVDGEPRIVSDPPLLVPIDDMLPGKPDRDLVVAGLTGLIAKYRRTLETDRRYLLEQFEFADMARKVVGVGSVGTRCWIVLMLGRHDTDPLFLQVKEAEPSVLSRYLATSKYANQGQRVVAGQRLMQASSDIFLGWQRVQSPLDAQSRDFYIRQLRDWKFSIDIEAMVPSGMQMYGELCGWTLARAHACSGDRIAIASYLGGSAVFDKAIAAFAGAYADQNERDYDGLCAAVASGKITAAADK
jgi:hypothetical protein